MTCHIFVVVLVFAVFVVAAVGLALLEFQQFSGQYTRRAIPQQSLLIDSIPHTKGKQDKKSNVQW